MKKLIALLLAVFMLLSGCAAGTTTIKEEKALTELGEGKREESMAVVKVTINPEFELYLDIDFNVTKVRCLNEDAVTTLEAVQTDLVGNNYGAAMFSILDAANQAGFLAPDAQVKIETTLHTPMDEAFLQPFAEEMANAVKVYSENNGLSLAVESVTPTVDEKAAEAFMEYYKSNPPTTDQSFVVNGNEASGDLYDENGNKVGTFLDVYDVYGPEGHLLKAERFYDDGTYAYDIYEYDSNGHMSRWEYARADGSSGEQTYFANGSLKSDTANFADGTSSYSTYEYDANGTLIKEETVHSDGSSGVYTYFPNGSIETSVWIASEGYTITETYYESGTLKSSISDYDGDRFEYHYAEDGTLIEEVIVTRPWNMGEPNSVQEVQVYNDHGEGTSTQYFNENGYLYKSVDVYPDGATYEITYYESGIIRSNKWNDPNGSGYAFYAEDGTYLPNIGEPNSVIEITTCTLDGQGKTTKYFDENGYLYKAEEVMPDGSVYHYTYYQNGNQKTCISSGGYQWEYYEDGTLQKYIETSPGKYFEVHYYTNGQMSLQILREGSINLERHYDEEGNVTYSNEPGWQP